MSIITEFELPTHCEYCNSKLEWDSVNLICSNSECINKLEENLKAWCMNLAPIDGLGWKTIKKVLSDSYYSYHYDNIVFNVEKIMSLEQEPGIVYGKGERGMFNKMLDILQNGKFTVSQFLLALNIPGLGKISAKRWEESNYAWKLIEYIICSEYDIIYETDKEYQQLVGIIQDKNTVNSILNEYKNYFRDCYYFVENRIIFNNLVNHVKKGKVAITGSLSIKRSEFEDLLTNNGWELSNSLNKDVKYLITNSPNSCTVKNKKADELNVQKVTEEEFINTYLK